MKKKVLMTLVLLTMAGAMISAQSLRDRFNQFLDVVEEVIDATNTNNQPTNPNNQPTNPNTQPTNPNTQPTNPNTQPANTNNKSAGTVQNTSGKLNYSGGKIPAKYNGQHIIAAAVDTNSDISLFAAASISSDGTITGARISGGNAALQVWRSSNEDLVNFNGSGNYMLITYVLKQAVMTKADWEKAQEAMKANPLKPGSWCAAADIMGNATFSSGTGAANINRFMDF
jgi:hypothetical protein